MPAAVEGREKPLKGRRSSPTYGKTLVGSVEVKLNRLLNYGSVALYVYELGKLSG